MDGERKFQQAEGNSRGALRDVKEQRLSPSKSVPNLDQNLQMSLPQSQQVPGQQGGAIYDPARQFSAETPFPSPDQVATHQSKTDSGSNPDSGYSSRIYGMRPFMGKPPATSTPANNGISVQAAGGRNNSIGMNASSIMDASSPATFNSASVAAPSDTYHSSKSTFQVQAQVHHPVTVQAQVHNPIQVQAQVHNPSVPSYVERWYDKKPKQQNMDPFPSIKSTGYNAYTDQYSGVKPTREIGRATQV